VSTLERVLEVLGTRLVLSVDWRGGELDRLLDADHAALAERWAARRPGWIARAEVTYSRFGERGSIDELALHSPTACVLVTELKTGIYDAQRAVAKLDQKVRLAGEVARGIGWDVRRVVGCLVVADTRTNRRRVTEHAALFGRFNIRGRAATAWLRDPSMPIGGVLMFVPLSNVPGMNGRRAGRQRVRHPGTSTSVRWASHPSHASRGDA
jgi:hypothetical protein